MSRLVRATIVAILVTLLICPVSPALGDLGSAIDAVVARESLAAGLVGVAVCDPATSAMLYEHNGAKAMLPASTMKTISCAYALETLGPDHRFRTTAKVEALEQGAVSGPLYLVGSGDPFTHASDLSPLAESIAQAGITSVPGGVVADVSLFSGRRWRGGWTADDFTYGYGAWPDAINLNRQTTRLTVRPGAVDSPAQVDWDIPEVPFEIANETLTVPEGGHTELWVDRSLDSNRFTVTGTIALGAEPRAFDRSFVDPGLVAATLLAARLRDRGVEVGDHIGYGEAPPSALEVAALESLPLREILDVTLKISDNLAAELLVWTTAIERGSGPSFADAMGDLTRWLEARGMPMDGLRLADGSGLSRYDYLTPRFLARHMASMVESPLFSIFRDCLPVAGVDGTLGNRFRGSILEGKVAAKTGSLSRVACLTGYAPRDDGSLLAFAVLSSGHDCPTEEVYRAQEDIIAAIMTEELPE